MGSDLNDDVREVLSPFDLDWALYSGWQIGGAVDNGWSPASGRFTDAWNTDPSTASGWDPETWDGSVWLQFYSLPHSDEESDPVFAGDPPVPWAHLLYDPEDVLPPWLWRQAGLPVVAPGVRGFELPDGPP